MVQEKNFLKNTEYKLKDYTKVLVMTMYKI